ncbi:MAG: L-threonylcarbamoyladenylate synthase [Patescibacteria group bacterium]|nr:L-threonylcarbamoyladenylate synthase [Patescibacteria group bacterium]
MSEILKFNRKNLIKVGDLIKKGKIGVIPTDTIYGLVAKALDKKAVERVYQIKKRNKKKAVIVLIGSIKQLDLFKIKIDRRTEDFTKKIWPGRVSLIFFCSDKKFWHLTRQNNSLAFRLPQEKWLIDLIKKTGPIIAPSANIENKPSARTIKEAKVYFDDQIDFYLDRGELIGQPSILLKILR